MGIYPTNQIQFQINEGINPQMNNNQVIESCSHSNPEYSVPGHLFLVNDWEERNPTLIVEFSH